MAGSAVDGGEVDAALADGKIALVLALESAPGVGEDVELLETLYRLGVRIASLAHFGRTPLADGSGEDAAGSRLTRAGVAALAEMERIGMMFDISHLGAAGVDHVLELATRPVIATHSSARALRDHHRNLTDDQLRAIAANGGVVCVNFFAPFLPRATHLDRLVDHIEHLADVTGLEHVGLGPDFVHEVFDEMIPMCDRPVLMEGMDVMLSIPGLDGPTGLPMVTEALLARGMAEDEVRKVLGGNALRLLRSQIGVPQTP